MKLVDLLKILFGQAIKIIALLCNLNLEISQVISAAGNSGKTDKNNGSGEIYQPSYQQVIC